MLLVKCFFASLLLSVSLQRETMKSELDFVFEFTFFKIL